MTHDEQIETLDVFIESANELTKSTFLKQTTDQGISTFISARNGGLLMSGRVGPDHEAVKALLLTVRFFCQDNEPSSVRNMAEMVASLPVPSDLKSQFAKTRDGLNTYLDTENTPSFPTVIGTETRRAIFETFLYGTFAHANRNKRRLVKAWEQEFQFVDLRATFDCILCVFVKAVCVMATICQQIRDHLMNPVSRVFSTIVQHWATLPERLNLFTETHYSFEEWLNWEAVFACLSAGMDVLPRPCYRTEKFKDTGKLGDLLVTFDKQTKVIVEVTLVHDTTAKGIKWDEKIEDDRLKLLPPYGDTFRALQIVAALTNRGTIPDWLNSMPVWSNPKNLQESFDLEPPGIALVRGWVV